MGLLVMCERCGRRDNEWTVREARIEVGEIQRKARLCRGCTVIVQAAIGSVLPPMVADPPPCPTGDV